ncbi:MAG: zinc-ribbon domain-containing protein, partial [Chloroflexi bacterium]|nr:zinc-ribbon domain-containing protein [Chloroflexota bacterium]
MICPECGHENPTDAETCLHCGQALLEEQLPRPRLLAHIQGLIPPEPIISTGQLGVGRAPAAPALIVGGVERTGGEGEGVEAALPEEPEIPSELTPGSEPVLPDEVITGKAEKEAEP